MIKINLMKSIFTTLLLLFAIGIAHSQSWTLLSNSPAAGFRHDDLFFINPDTGWVVNVDGYIYKTTDGGNSFITQLNQPSTSFRCVGFANAAKGWAGNLGTGSWSPTTDTLPLYQTLDSGNTWQAVTNITGPLPKGICGISVVNDTVVYACGRVGGPAYIMKTTDGGASWTSAPFLNAFYLVDCHFFSVDTGIVVGCTGTSFANELYAVYYTTDGGQTWIQTATTTTFNGHGWKIDFPSRYTGYVSIETSGTDSVPVLKTTDGGLTWQEKLWSAPIWFAQGIGFINDSTGWCGSSMNEVKQTTDAGDTWNIVPFVYNFNRFRKINDTLAYASGNRIWKYSSQLTTISEQEYIPGVILNQNFPNPFKSKTTISYTLPHVGNVVLRIYDPAGRPVKTLVNAKQNKGSYSVNFSAEYFYDTHFYCTLYFDDYMVSKKMVMRK
jgi:photosystem II stability/assembly factor-like uncharacterized protein